MLILLPTLLVTHAFGGLMIITRWYEIQEEHPRLDETMLPVAIGLIVLSMIGLIATWYWRRWGVGCVVAAYLLAISFDVYFEIFFHLYVASGAILLYGIALWPARTQLR